MKFTRNLQLLLASCVLAFSTTVSAQPAAEPMQVDDATLEQFAVAFAEVDNIRREYTTSIGEAEDQAEAQQLQQEAQVLMVEAVQGSGLDVETYNQIAQQLQTDTDLQQRIEALLN